MNDLVALQTPFGFVVGMVVGFKSLDANASSFGSVLRLATPSDIELYVCKLTVEREAVALCRDVILKNALSTGIAEVIDVEYNWNDGDVFILTNKTSLHEEDISALQERFVPTISVTPLPHLEGFDCSLAEVSIQHFSDILEAA